MSVFSAKYSKGIELQEVSNAAAAATGYRRLEARTDGWYDVDDAGVATRLQMGTGWVNYSGTPAANQVAIFEDADTIRGDADMTFVDGKTLKLTAQVYVDPTMHPHILLQGTDYDMMQFKNPSGNKSYTILSYTYDASNYDWIMYDEAYNYPLYIRGGYVGINMAGVNPTYPLQVIGDVKLTNDLIIGGLSTTILSAEGTPLGKSLYITNAAGGETRIRPNNASADYVFTDGAFYPVTSEGLGSSSYKWANFYSSQITDDGTYVGIGTTPNSNYKLTVSRSLNLGTAAETIFPISFLQSSTCNISASVSGGQYIVSMNAGTGVNVLISGITALGVAMMTASGIDLGTSAVRWGGLYTSKITDNKTSVGINNASPSATYALDVTGKLYVSDYTKVKLLGVGASSVNLPFWLVHIADRVSTGSLTGINNAPTSSYYTGNPSLVSGIQLVPTWSPGDVLTASRILTKLSGASSNPTVSTNASETTYAISVTSMVVYEAYGTANAYGSITGNTIGSFYSFIANNPSISATHWSIGTAYAFYDAGQTAATTNWGLGINTQSYINASLSIGKNTAPTVSLDVEGNAKIFNSTDFENLVIELGSDGGDVTLNYSSTNWDNFVSASYWSIKNSTTTPFVLYNTATTTGLFTLRNNRVGVLNANPQYELDVTGGINLSGSITFDGTGAAIGFWEDVAGGGMTDTNIGVPTSAAVMDWVQAQGYGTGTIGGSIAEDQVAVGAATANTIEGSNVLTFDVSTGNLTIGSATVDGKLTLRNGSGTVSHLCADGTTSVNYYWPTTGYADDYVLSTDVDGNLFWAAPYTGVGVFGTPADGQVAVWKSANAIEGTSSLVFDSALTNYLSVITDSASGGIHTKTYANFTNTTNSAWWFYSNRGTAASPAVITNGQQLGQILFGGAYASETYDKGAEIVAIGTETWGTYRGTKLEIKTYSTSGSYATRLAIEGSGRFGLSNSATVSVDTIETAITDDDTHIPTSGAVVDYIKGRKITVPHTFTFPKTVSGSTNLPGMFVKVPSGVTVKLTAIRYAIESGTSISFKLRRRPSGGSWADISGFGTSLSPLSATTTATTTDPTDVTLSDLDEIRVELITASGTPTDFRCTLFIEYGAE